MVQPHLRHEFTQEELDHYCIIGDCTGWRKSRGLCFRHYQLAYNAVRKHAVTWEVLEHKGAALPRSGCKW